jgi:hypothetical protein
MLAPCLHRRAFRQPLAGKTIRRGAYPGTTEVTSPRATALAVYVPAGRLRFLWRFGAGLRDRFGESTGEAQTGRPSR